MARDLDTDVARRDDRDFTRRDERDTIRRDERAMARSQTARSMGVLERFADEVDRVFDDFGLGRGWSPMHSHRWFSSSQPNNWTWSPEIEVFHRNNELVVRADLPGMTAKDVKVDVTEDHLTIEGERREEHQEEHDGVFRTERRYGTFHRDVPLPPGTMSDQAKAKFTNGVLEVTMPAAPDSTQGKRRLEIE